MNKKLRAVAAGLVVLLAACGNPPPSNTNINSEACTLALNLYETLKANEADEVHIRAAYRDVVRACD